MTENIRPSYEALAMRVQSTKSPHALKPHLGPMEFLVKKVGGRRFLGYRHKRRFIQIAEIPKGLQGDGGTIFGPNGSQISLKEAAKQATLWTEPNTNSQS